MNHKFKLATQALHAGYEVGSSKSTAIPLYRTSSYHFNDTDHAANLFALKEPGNIYSRIMNPTQDVLEKRIAQMEGGAAALALASGTSAIHYSIINICKQGDEFVSSSNLYGGTYTMFDSILPDQGIKARFVDISNYDQVRAAINEKTRLIYTEVIGNPALDVANISELAKIADEYQIPLVVDSTFTPPCLFRPIEHGAHIVIHSLTKWIGGHGTVLGGIVVDSGTFNWKNEKFVLYNEPDKSYGNLRYAHDLGDNSHLAFILRLRLVPLRNLGACLSADSAWQILQGIETLTLRMKAHSENALAAAKFLKEHPAVSWVRYPGLEDDPSFKVSAEQFKNGFGGMVIFGVKGGIEAGKSFINNLKVFSHLANVGDAKSLAIHPASTTHSQLSPEQLESAGITSDLIRLSVGIEDIDDILYDIDQALSA